MDKYIHIRIKAELKEQLKDEAKKLDISLNDYIRMILNKRKE